MRRVVSALSPHRVKSPRRGNELARARRSRRIVLNDRTRFTSLREYPDNFRFSDCVLPGRVPHVFGARVLRQIQMFDIQWGATLPPARLYFSGIREPFSNDVL